MTVSGDATTVCGATSAGEGEGIAIAGAAGMGVGSGASVVGDGVVAGGVIAVVAAGPS